MSDDPINLVMAEIRTLAGEIKRVWNAVDGLHSEVNTNHIALDQDRFW